MRLKTQFWAKDMRVVKDIYRKNYDQIKWEKPRKDEKKRDEDKSA